MTAIAEIAQRAISNATAPATANSPVITRLPDFPWEFEAYNVETARALETVIWFLAKMESRQIQNRETGPKKPQGEWLTFSGPNGCGKTHLASKIDEWRRSRSPGVSFYRWIDLLSLARGGETKRIMDRADEPRLMVIDDIAAGHETEFTASILGELAERRTRLWTVWTSNLSLGQIAHIDSRVASRMLRDGSTVFEFEDTPDFNLKPEK